MRIPVKWLNKYVKTDNIDIKILEEKMILSGSNIETVESVLGKIKKIVVGQCKSLRQHPDADKLSILDIDIGEEELLQIVTGAKNVNVGDFVPVALHKSNLYDGTQIKRGKLRGELSNGMLCSLEELGFDKRVIPKSCADGIYILEGEHKLGSPISEVMELDDYVIEFEITPNRPDCLSLLGMAREVSATFELPLMMPDVSVQKEVDDINDYVSIAIEDSDLCHRLASRVIKDVKVAPSPLWLQTALIKAGMRPLNNIVDITNYVLLEWGQPLHAYDLDKLNGHKMIARRAKSEEKLMTLDGTQRILTNDMLVIADDEGAVGIAGVMGGGNSEVTNSTKTIALEMGSFFKSNIRQTSRVLGLRSESSSRFEKGVSPEYIPQILDRVCHLIESIGAGTVVKGTLDLYPQKMEIKNIDVRLSKINNLLGIFTNENEVQKYLSRLDIKTEVKTDGDEIVLICTPPAYRLDLIEEIDYVEEVARLYGYDKMPLTLPKGDNWGHRNNLQKLRYNVRNAMTSIGANEILTYSFVGGGQYDKMNIDKNDDIRKAVTLKNALGEEYSMMRRSLVGNMLDVLARNSSRSIEEAFAFEIGNVFIPKQWPVSGLPDEKTRLCVGLYGDNEDFFTMKGYMERFFSYMNVDTLDYKATSEVSWLHSGRCAAIYCNEELIGYIGELHPTLSDNYGFNSRVYIADIDFTTMRKYVIDAKFYKPLPKFPASTRDMALVVKKSVLAGDVKKVISDLSIDILESAKLFDVYEGEQIEEGYKSLAYALFFRHDERTLTDEEVNVEFDKILEALKNKLDARLR